MLTFLNFGCQWVGSELAMFCYFSQCPQCAADGKEQLSGDCNVTALKPPFVSCISLTCTSWWLMLRSVLGLDATYVHLYSVFESRGPRRDQRPTHTPCGRRGWAESTQRVLGLAHPKLSVAEAHEPPQVPRVAERFPAPWRVARLGRVFPSCPVSDRCAVSGLGQLGP